MKLKPGQNNLYWGLKGPRCGIKRDMWVPLGKKKQNKHKDVKKGKVRNAQTDSREENFFLFFILFSSFCDSRVSNRRISSGK